MACSTLPGGLLYSSISRSSAWLGSVQQRRGRVSTSVWSKSCLPFVVKAVTAQEECNEEECAPEKEVGKVSMEWKAEESTKVLGTYPPISKKKWTGYVEKDTAGQTNIYAVEPTVYVSENVISSNTVGDSSTGSEQTLVVSVGLALGLLVGAGVVLQGVSSTPAAFDASSYTGPSLSYYIQKFKPVLSSSSSSSTSIESVLPDESNVYPIMPASSTNSDPDLPQP